MVNIAHAAGEGIAIHLAPTILGYFLGVPITNTLITSVVVVILLVIAVFFSRKRLKMIPGKFQIVIELLIGGTYDYVEGVLEDKKLTRTFFPLIMTLFIFILSLNWFGLFPGVDSIGFHQIEHGKEVLVPFLHPANTDLNVTFALALIAFVVIELAGVVLLGFLKYGGKFVNFSSPLAFLIGIIELFSEIARLISFSFRLFGNIFAGKTLLLITMFFVPFVLPVPILAFEMFVGFIQAFIFSVLVLFFVKLAVQEPH